MSKAKQQAGEALARAFTARGVRCDRELAAQVADLLLDLVQRGVLVSAEDPIVNNMGSSVQESSREAV